MILLSVPVANATASALVKLLIAKLSPYVDSTSNLVPDHNADSIAYFAMGM
jgi:hypothetical protein